MSVFDSAPQLSIWAVQVTNLDHTKQPTLFCAASADPDVAVALVRQHCHLDESAKIEALFKLSDATALGVVEISGLQQNGVAPWESQ